MINRLKDNCLPLDKVEQAKCEEHFESQGHSDYETKRLIMKNCPCHYNCYNSGCANCGGWECPNSDSHIDAATGNKSPKANGASPHDTFVLEYSDEFEGSMINSNKWKIIEKDQQFSDLGGKMFIYTKVWVFLVRFRRTVRRGPHSKMVQN